MPSKSKSQQRLMAAHEAAYIAGFIDGEGTIGIVAHNKPTTLGGRDRRTPHYRLVIGITNRDLCVLRWICERCGGSIFEKVRRKATWAPAFELRITNRDDGRALLVAIQPFAHIKSAQIQLALDFLDLGLARVTFSARGKTWPRRVQHPEDVEAREAMKQRMNGLNQRGLRIAG